jgi:hypothetical protein
VLEATTPWIARPPLQAQIRNPFAREIDLIETAPIVKRTETHHNIWSLWWTFYNSKNRRGVIAPCLKAPILGVPSVRALFETTYLAGLRKGGNAGGMTAAKLVGSACGG